MALILHNPLTGEVITAAAELNVVEVPDDVLTDDAADLINWLTTNQPYPVGTLTLAIPVSPGRLN